MSGIKWGWDKVNMVQNTFIFSCRKAHTQTGLLELHVTGAAFGGGAVRRGSVPCQMSYPP